MWQLLLLSKAQWQAVHTIVALAFLVAAGFHIYFNWKVLVAYLKSKLQAGIRMKRELAAASVTGAVILAVSITGLPPFGTVMDVGEEIKNSWSTTSSEPPVPHAELMTVAKLSETVKIPTEKALANLEKQGITVAQPTMTVQQIADENKLTPQQVYQKIQSEDAKPKVTLAEGGGWGRMNVQQVCERYSVPVEAGVARLQAAGFEASGDHDDSRARHLARQDAHRRREDHRGRRRHRAVAGRAQAGGGPRPSVDSVAPGLPDAMEPRVFRPGGLHGRRLTSAPGGVC